MYQDFLIFTDIHLHQHKKSEQRLRDCLEVLEWVFQEARSRNIKTILFAGDFFHDRNKIDLLTCHETFMVLRKNLDGSIKMHMILGNHDLWYYEKSTVSSVTMLSSLPNVFIYDRPCFQNIDGVDWHLLPFTHNTIQDLEKLQNSITKNTFLLGHIAVDGAKLNSAGSIAEIEVEHDGDMIKVNKDLFKSYKHVFLGHYHGYQKLCENVEYVGSPLQLNFGEANEQKFILHLSVDTTTGKFVSNYIENEFSPRHFSGTFEEICKIDKKYTDKAFISLISDKENKDEDFKDIENLNKLGIKNIRVKKIQSSIIDQEKALTIQTSKSILENSDTMIKEYVKHINPDFDHENLINIGNKIVNICMSEGE